MSCRGIDRGSGVTVLYERGHHVAVIHVEVTSLIAATQVESDYHVAEATKESAIVVVNMGSDELEGLSFFFSDSRWNMLTHSSGLGICVSWKCDLWKDDP